MAEVWREELPQKLKAMKIIVVALTGSCLLAMAIFFTMSLTTDSPVGLYILSYIALGFAGLAMIELPIASKFIVSLGRKAILRQFRPEESDGARAAEFASIESEAGCRLIALLSQKTIICSAIAEGAAFFAVITYYIERSPILPVVAVAMTILVLLQFPTHDRSANWIEKQLQLLKDEY
jgi:hypothetical protein